MCFTLVELTNCYLIAFETIVVCTFILHLGKRKIIYFYICFAPTYFVINEKEKTSIVNKALFLLQRTFLSSSEMFCIHLYGCHKLVAIFYHSYITSKVHIILLFTSWNREKNVHSNTGLDKCKIILSATKFFNLSLKKEKK